MSLKEILEKRKAEIEASLEALVSGAEAEERALTPEEDTTNATLIAEHREVVTKIAAAVEADGIRSQVGVNTPAGVAPVTSVSNPNRDGVYLRGQRDSYFRDLADSRKGDNGAIERLTRNDRHNADLEKRAGTTTVAGAGGEFAPPLWLIDEFVALARPGRPVADLVKNIAIPRGVSSVSLPKVTTGTATGTQGTQNVAITSQDIVTTSVTTGITTQAGGVVVSRQILDQSPISMDEVIIGDLGRDLAQKIDLAVIAAIVAAAGNAITYTDASPTTAKLLPYIQQAIDQVGLGIYTPNSLVGIARTDRWGRFAAAVDTTGRPLLALNTAYGPWNAKGVQSDPVTGQGPVGSLQGIGFVTDAQVPNNLGGGTNQDEIIVLDPTQVFLFESAPTAEAFDQTYANTMSVYCRMYEYYGIIANRLPKAISTITGTGLVPYAYGS